MTSVIEFTLTALPKNILHAQWRSIFSQTHMACGMRGFAGVEVKLY